MRGDRRRSPPGDERRFSGGGGRGWDAGRRRQRSPSPDRFRRGSPPGKRYRRDDYDDYDRPGGRFDRGNSYRGRDRYDDRYDDRPPPPRGPMTFVEFVRDLPPQMGPEQAAGEYRRYLADWWGDAIKAEFEERKHEAGVRRRFDPREIARVQERRNELAQAAATSLAAEFTEGGTLADEEHAPPGPDGFTDEAAAERDRAEREREGEPAPALAPALCWRPAQVAADLALAKQLMATVDKEKGVAENPLLPQPAADAEAAGGEDEGAAGGAQQAAAAEGEQAAAEGEGEQQAPAGEQQQQQQDGGSGPADMDAELSPEEQLAKLDQVLAYLWRVHGIDFYGGREFTNPAERGRAVARRTRRGPQPSAAELAAAAEAAAEADTKEGGGAAAGEAGEAGQQEGEAAGEGAGEGAAAAAAEGGEGGEGAAAASPTAAAAEAKSPTAASGVLAAGTKAEAAAADGDEKEYERRVTGFWKFRIEKGDPLEGPLQRKRIEEGVEAFVEAQIIKIDDNKWGNKLSQKMFMGREFVVKHIRNKHGHVLDAERERLQEEAFWENFRAFKQEEQRRQEEEQERVMAGMAGRGPGALAAGGVLPLEGASAVLNPAGGMVMAPILMPAAGGMAPIIMPVDMVMGMGMAAGAMGGRGGRGSMRGMPMGGRGGGRGGRGMGGPMPGAKLDAGGTVREYFDLDAPQNNRAVLDYGDL